MCILTVLPGTPGLVRPVAYFADGHWNHCQLEPSLPQLLGKQCTIIRTRLEIHALWWLSTAAVFTVDAGAADLRDWATLNV